MRSTLRVLFLLLGWTALWPMQVAWGQICATPGKDGTTFTTSPNTYYPGVGTAAVNATSVSVGAIRTGTGASATPIGAGDLLLVIQMQGADINNSDSNSYGDGVAGGAASGNLTANLTAGQYEYVAVSSVSGTTVTLTTGLKNAYTSSAAGVVPVRTFQVVRVPQYSSLALTADILPPFWNGSTGGIIALDVQGQLNFGTATINASALGFRGGAGVQVSYSATTTPNTQNASDMSYLRVANATRTLTLNAMKGEGIAGTPRYVNQQGALSDLTTDGYPGGSAARGAPGNAGGGGNDNGNNSGGGGGGNAGPGGRGGLSAANVAIGGEPGAAFSSSPSVLIMGGGGGAGTTNDGSGGNAGFASSGATGGGIVIVRTGTVSGSGGIAVDGGNAPSGVRNDGAGGGGAGGSILLTATSSQAGLTNLTLSAKGGAGGTTRPVDAGNNSTAHGPGGGGGGGVIFSTGPTQNTLAASTTGGASGTSTPGTGGQANSPTDAYGAANGSNASAANGSTSTSNTITNSSAGAVCSPIVLAVPAACANAGKDGATFTATPNTYYPGVGTAAVNATSVSVGAIRTGTGASATPIGAGDLLLVIQMQGADINNSNSTSYGSTTNLTAGQYEYVVVSSVSGSTVTLSSGLKNAYTSSAAGVVPVRTFQVVRVPQYSSLTLTASIAPPAWNGSTGGIIALDVAGAINLNGNTINVSGLGFRGGAGRVLTTSNFDDASYLTTAASGFNAQKGEGLAGTPQFVNNGGVILNTNVDGYPGGSAARGAPGNAGGGGNDNLNNSGGGGAANGGSGGRGGNNFLNNQPIGGDPGAAFAASGTSLVLGGGGGAGATNNGSGGNAGLASSGSAGGGIVIVRAGSVAGTGSVLANAAATLTGVLNDGGGGGGAGGSILITAVTPGGLNGLTLSANGAIGGSTNPNAASPSQGQHGPGGGGGGGIIFTNGAVASATANGGASGVTTYSGGPVGGVPYGAAAGNAGQISTNATTGAGGSAGIISGANCTSVTGTVFDDSNYGGGSGRALGTATSSASASGLSSIGSAGTTVELYNSTGGLVATTTTTAGGAYTFSGLTAGANYTVRVVNSTVKSARTPGATGLVPVQTFRTTAYIGAGLGAAVSDGARVGGEAPEKQDAAANNGSQTLAALTAGTVTPESITSIAAGTTGVDFGYNFDVVVNTNDTGQGSLRQFIANANALGNENQLAQAGSSTNAVNLAAGNTTAGRAGVALPAGIESSIFMIPAGRLTNGVAVITPATALPQITGPNTAINGSTQTFNIGNSNDVLLGAGGSVGTGTAITTLSRLNGPEVQLVGSTAVATGLNIAGAGSRVTGLAIYGFGNNTDDNGNANIATSANNVSITANALGSTATTFAAPAVASVSADVRVASGTGLSFTNNLVGFAGGSGIYLGSTVTGTTITGNEIRGNGRLNTAFDGVDSRGSSTTATSNLFADGAAQGFDSFSSTGSNVVTGNTFTNNGIGNATSAPQETAAARFYGTGNTFSQNASTGNYGAGVEVVNGSTTLISRNSIFNNGNVASANGTAASGQVGIDLVANGGNENAGNTPFVTLNSATNTGGNGLINYPILRTATIVGTNLVLTGYAKAGATIELFTAQANPAAVNATGANFGQGRTYLTTLTEGVADTDPATGQSYSGNINGFNQGTDTNASAFRFTIPLASLPGGTLAPGTVLTSTATLTGATSEFSGIVTAVPPLTGFVYEDVNYGGGAGRSRATLNTAAIGRPGAKVELYNNAGALVGTAITDANGQYAFNAPVGTGYTVRVVNNSVLSSRTGATAASGSATAGYVSNQLAVQTYNGTTTRVGGENPALTDAAANTGTQTLAALTSGTNVPQSIATVNVGTGTTNAGPDFGYNFDVVVNTNNAGQGSLAQFINNANALGGEASLAQAGSNSAGTLPAGLETSIFMIPIASLTNGVANINLTTALPQVESSNLSIDGTTQTINIGNTNNVALGAGGTVGTGGTALSQLNGPEVQIKGPTMFSVYGIDIADNTATLSLSNIRVRGLSIYGFLTGIFAGVNNTGIRIEQNVIGASATSFTDPGASNRNQNEGIDLNDSDNGFVTNNLIGFNGGMGVWVITGGGNGSNGANNNSITGNEIRSNALITNLAGNGGGERMVYDGLELQGSSTGNTVSGNLITANVGHGIDSFANGIGGNTVTGNTISDNGVGVANNTGEEGSGLRVFGATNPTIISNNVLTGNNGSGVLVLGTANKVTISQNSTSGNTRLGIDLLTTGETNLNSSAPGTPFWNGNTGATSNVTLNDNGDTATGGNGLLNYPVLTTATLNATNLVVTGYARPGSLVELFLAAPLTTDLTANNRYFGQGSSFLAGRTEGLAADDSNAGTGTYGPATINGVAQGTDNTNLFTFSIPLSSLTTAQRTALANNTALLTATATAASSTSEFSADTRVLQAPVPNDVTNVSVANNQATPVVLNPNVSATAIGLTSDITTSTANTIASYVVSPVASVQGTLFYNGSAVTAATTVLAANIGQLTFVPTRGFVGNATFSYTAIDANGTVSTTHNTNGTVTNGPATYTIPVTTAADVTASLTGGTTLSPGQPTGYYTATFTNLGPNAASSVAQVVTLPTGASLPQSQRDALTAAYPGTTFATTGSGTTAVTTITFAPVATLASGLSNSFRFAFTAPTTAGGSTLTASTSTTSNEGANVAPNSTNLAITTIGVVDLQATIVATSATVAPGATATFTATFTNNSAPTAAGVVATVQLIPGLTAATLTVGGQTGTLSGTTITFANGATYSTTTGQIAYPTTTLGNGASVSSAIAFTMPASGVVTATAGVTTTTTEGNPANNVASASITAGPQFDLATTISGPTAVVAGSPVTLSVTTTNNSGQAVAGAVQTVQLPAGLNPTVNSPGVFISNGGTYDNASGLVTFPALGSLPSGQTVANTITFVSPTAAFTPSAQVAPSTGDTNTANNTAFLNGAANSTAAGATLTPATATATVANLTATLTTTSTIVNAATAVTYTVGASNAGPGAAANAVGQLQLLPGLNATTLLVNGLGGTLLADNVTYSFADGTDYKTVRYNSQTGLLSYAATAASLASGTSFSFPVAVTVPATVGNEGQLLATNSVSSATSDNVPADNVKAVTVTVRPTTDLVATLTGPTSGVVPGQSVTYTATFTNNGPDAARATAETVQLPSGLTTTTLTVGGQTGTFNGMTNTIDFANGASYNPLTGLVTLPTLASDAAGAVQAFNLTFVAPAQSYVVSSAISSGTTDTTPANNAASVATTVTPTADVAIALAGPATAVIGNYVTYTVTTTNNGVGRATNVVPTVLLPTGLTIANPSQGTYDPTTGLVTFPTITSLQAGVGFENYVTFIMPNATGGQLSALASVSSGSLDNVPTNNTTGLTTSVAPTTTTTADLITSISPTGGSVAPGSTVTYTATYRNAGPGVATNVVRTANLPTGLAVSDLAVGGVTGTLANGLITFGSGPAIDATYDVATGLLTFPTIASQNSGANSYSVSFSAPTSGQLVVFSTVSSNTTDPAPGTNRNGSSISVDAAFDLTTSVSGPAAALAGSQNVYTIKTINNGPSSAPSAAQNVQLPAGLTTSTLLVAGQTGTLSGTTISYSNSGASYNTGSGLLTFAGISNLAPGLNNAVSNTITVTMPTTGSLTIGNATVSTTATGESNSANNTATFTTITAPLSFAPVAQNIVNSLRGPEGNTANALTISPLNALDPDGSVANYYVQSLPTSGTLFYNGVAIASIPSGGYLVANPALLSFDPASTSTGAVFFTYTATDNSGVGSNTALYTIPVAQDIASTYTAYNTTKGGATAYQTNDVLAQVIDPNKAVYTSAGIIYNATTGALQAGAANGLLTTGTNAVLATTGPASNPSNSLPAGVSLDAATGSIFVSNASQLVNNPAATTYSVLVNTTDANGGITQALATFTLGAYPLPVVLTDFTAQAVGNRDALLNWHTASEKNNDYFEVERSFDGILFAPLGRVAGHGTSSAASAYTLTDAGVAAQATGPVYYRLRQVDLDGKSTYSPQRTVSFLKAATVKLSLYPNPVVSTTTLDLSQLPATGIYQVVLLDATGRSVRAWTLGGGQRQPLELTSLASGSYLLVVTGNLASGVPLRQTMRLTKE